ncbi:MAG: LapA family protein [Candidatus Parcubacteria bacterium]|nr:LapA family protein [Candidatus Parcubacteria bacterium]
MIFSLIFGVILGALSVIFILENTSIVTITFLSWQFDGSLALILMLTLISGIFITLLLLLPSYIRDTFYLSALEKHKKGIDGELVETKRKLADAMDDIPRPGVIVVEKIHE